MKRCFFLFPIILVFVFAFPAVPSANVADYPLQQKYPNIMLYEGQVKHKIIALTFDDGPDNRFTPQVLDVLNKHHVQATFFLMGSRIKKHPQVAKRIAEDGHALGNHTYWHPQLTKTGVHNMKWEIKQTRRQMKAATGQTTDLFRPPFGAVNDKLVKAFGDMDYRGIGWSIDTNDWRELPPKKIESNVMHHAHPGAIVLMHSAGHWSLDLSGTVKALDDLIPKLKKEGYHFVTIPELWDASHKKIYK